VTTDDIWSGGGTAWEGRGEEFMLDRFLCGWIGGVLREEVVCID